MAIKEVAYNTLAELQAYVNGMRNWGERGAHLSTVVEIHKKRRWPLVRFVAIFEDTDDDRDELVSAPNWIRLKPGQKVEVELEL